MNIVLTRRESLHLPDGINVFIFALAEELIGRGHAVTVVSTCRFNAETVRETFRCREYPKLVSLTDRDHLGYLSTGKAWLLRGFSVVRRLKPDAVIINGAIPMRMPGHTALVSHDVEQRVPQHRRVRIAYKKFCYSLVDEIVGTCSEVANDLATEIATDRQRIRVIPTCINVANYDPLPLERRRRGILHMGTVGYKAPVASLQAFAKLGDTDSELFITGQMTPALRELLDRLPNAIRSKIHCGRFLTSSALKELIESVRVVSVPSEYSTPVASPTVLEAFAARTPVVCSHSISRDIIRPETNAIVTSTSDEMTAAFQRLLTDDALWQRLSSGAAETMVEYSAPSVARQYEELFSRQRFR